MDTTSQTNPKSLFDRLFRAHPAAVDETYAQHFGVAIGFAFWLALGAMAALIHALVPGLCEKTAGRIIRKMNARIENRG